MGLISRVSSRTYRKKNSTKKTWLTKKTTKWPPPKLKNPTSESPFPLKAQKPSTKPAPKFAAEQKPSTIEVRMPRLKSRDHDQCQLEGCELLPEKLHVVKVLKPGTGTRCEFTNESL